MKLLLGLTELPALVLAELYPQNGTHSAHRELSLKEFIAALQGNNESEQEFNVCR